MKRCIRSRRSAANPVAKSASAGSAKIVRMEIAPWDLMTEVGGSAGSSLQVSGGDFGFAEQPATRRTRRAS
jgi:hypothetical protein